MNSIHDMGGMHGFGPIVPEQDESMFHEPWEARVYAMQRAMGYCGGAFNLDNSRHQLELMPPADYLRMTYYERWFARLVDQLVKTNVITLAELNSGKSAADSQKGSPAVTAAMVPAMVTRRNSARRKATANPLFKVGQRVR